MKNFKKYLTGGNIKLVLKTLMLVLISFVIISSPYEVYGQSETEETEECEHTYESYKTDPTCQKAGHGATVCTKCGNVSSSGDIPQLAHNYSVFVRYEVEPTCTTSGTAIYSCPGVNTSSCGVTATKTAPTTGHSYTATCSCGATNMKCATCDAVKEIHTVAIPSDTRDEVRVADGTTYTVISTGSYYKVTGTSTASEVGTYSVTVAVDNTSRHKFTDGTTSYSFTWTIGENTSSGGTTERDDDEVDVIPPRCIVKVKGATYDRNGIYHTTSVDVVLQIEAIDNVTLPANMLMKISNTELSVQEIMADNWIPYESSTDWTLLDTADGKTYVYVYLKDETGNITPSMATIFGQKFKITYNGLGDNMPAMKEAYPGIAFYTAVQEPTLDGHHFLGWTSVEGSSSVQWFSDDIIPAGMINGDLPLYAVYSDAAPSLASRAQIGDYVDYPVDYQNVMTNEGLNWISKYTGWRVLGIDGNEVTLVSAGVPLFMFHSGYMADYDADIEKMTTGILNDEQYKEGENGINSVTLQTAFDNEYTDHVSTMTLDDIYAIKNDPDFVINNADSVQEFGSLICNGAVYWLATKSPDVDRAYYYVDGNGKCYNDGVWRAHGIRPKVYLKADVKTTGRNADGSWQLYID